MSQPTREELVQEALTRRKIKVMHDLSALAAYTDSSEKFAWWDLYKQVVELIEAPNKKDKNT